MTNARTVVFDLGKVLLDFDYGKSSRLFAARSKAFPARVNITNRRAGIDFTFS
jgi:hypothetical protein